MKFTEPDAWERGILQRNGIDPQEVSVMTGGEDYLIVKYHRTGDSIRIDQGDRPWAEKSGDD